MNATEIFAIIKDIALAGAACITAYAALTGLGRWQKELSGKASFDVARELAKSIYLLRNMIGYCRSPFIAASEFPENYMGSGKHSFEEEGQAWAYVYSKRWEPVGKAVQEFDAAALEAEALWGKEIKEKTLDLKKCVRSLQVDIEAFIHNKYSGGEDFKDKQFAKQVEQGIQDIKSKDNEFTQEINKAIEAIESVIRPKLSRS